ncbi:hypothetical protein [Rhodococcus sp. NCIMB 12038]|uniref:hypothetical protein n=1 Tax=Rhodococcus sp. NCIMB 12038 TaxID=933800 RepID=UPI00211B2D0D|nr:hypothetical protein [Rhodococcus sp. NCIMB 12038]
MTTERIALRALHDAAGLDTRERWRSDEAALAGELMRRKGATLESLREQGLSLANTDINTDEVIRTEPTPFALAALRLVDEHQDYADLPAYKQARLAAVYLPPADLAVQVADLREQLSALAREVNAVTEAADEQDRPDIVDALADVRVHLNDAAAELGEVIA